MNQLCPYCGERITNEMQCDACGKSIQQVVWVYKKSAAYYNLGLENAHKRDLTQAVHALKIALVLNKYHIQARNLLGLVLFEMGRIEEALGEWILSHAFQKESNLAGEYLKKLRNQPHQLENLRQSSELYNKGLMYFKEKNEDMALIRLKRAIGLNKNNVEARNLLAVYYLSQRKYSRATEQVKAVLKVDFYNPKAMYYLAQAQNENHLVNNTPVKTYQPEKRVTQPMQEEPVLQYYMPKQKPYQYHPVRNALLYLVIGLVSMWVIQTYLILPAQKEGLKKQLQSALQIGDELTAELNKISTESEQKIKDLEKQLKEVSTEAENLEENQSHLVQEQKLLKAKDLMVQRAYIEAAEEIYGIDFESLSAESKKTYEELKKEAYNRAGEALYKEGNTLYWSKEYDKAKADLEKVILYVSDNWIVGESLYRLGEIEKETGNLEKAKQYFQATIKEYEGSSAAYNANRSLTNMQ